MTEKKKTCFIIMPITTPESLQDRYRDGSDHFRHVLECLLIPSVEAAGYKAIPPKAQGSDLIHAEIIANLEKSDMVLCDMSSLNPNVFFEFGIRTSLNKPVCVVKDEYTKTVPFDTGILNHQEYKGSLEPWELAEEIKKLAEHLRIAEERSKGENSLWKFFGFRAEAQPYTGGTDTDDKIDYLGMQMDSLRQQVSNLLAHTSSRQMEVKGRAVDDQAIVDFIERFVASHAAPRSFRQSPDGSYVIELAGPIPDFERVETQELFKSMFGANLVLMDTSWVEEQG
jgi:hypothetical protein